MDVTAPKLAFTVEELAAATGIGRTRIFEAIKHGRLRARKNGRATIILAEDAREFLTALPARPAGRAQ